VPTASEYEDAAQRYLTISEHLLREAGAVGGWVPGFVSTGLIRTSLDESIGRTRTHLSTAGEEMRRLARVCEARAVVCADYARAVWRYLQLTLVEQLATGYPSRPATWVEM
jgi:hypothetical protein